MLKKKQVYLVIGVVMLGAVMRVPITAIPAVLTDIAASLQVPVSSLGFLTSLPLFMFALCSFWAPKWAEKVGLERLLGLVLFAMALASAMRVMGLSFLYAGTVVIGLAIAVINVLLPSFVAAHFPKKISFYTTIYVTIMSLTSALGAIVAVPIVAATSWQTFVLYLSGLVVMASLLWLPNMAYQKKEAVKKDTAPALSLWRNRAAIMFLFFGGLQSLLFYTELTWLPTMALSAGLSKAQAGFLAGLYSFISVPVSLVIPSLVTRFQKEQRAWFMAGVSVLTLIGLGMLPFAPAHFGYWLVVTTLLSLSVSALFPYMMLSFSLKTSSPQVAAELSGMVQSGGYLLASVGPVLLGYSYSMVQSWLPLIVVLFVVTVLMMVTIVLIEKEDVIG